MQNSTRFFVINLANISLGRNGRSKAGGKDAMARTRRTTPDEEQADAMEQSRADEAPERERLENKSRAPQ